MDGQKADSHSDYSLLADAIMNNYTCLACLYHYRKSDELATCPKCKRTRKEQIEAMQKDTSNGC